MTTIIISVTVITHIFIMQFTTIQMIPFYYDMKIMLNSGRIYIEIGPIEFLIKNLSFEPFYSEHIIILTLKNF